MNLYHIHFVQGDALFENLKARYFDLQELIDQSRESERGRNQEVLGKVLPNIRNRTPIGQWDADLCRRFVMMACRVWRSAAARSDENATDIYNLGLLAELLCSLVRSAGSLVSDQAKQQVCGIWIFSRLLQASALDDPAKFLDDASSPLIPLGIGKAEIEDQAKLQLVFFVAKRGLDQFPAVAETTRSWCAALLGTPAFRRLLLNASAPERLGVEVPPFPEGEGSAPSSSQGQPPAVPEPALWPKPESLNDQQRTTEFRECLFELLALANDHSSPLSQRTADHIRMLRPDSSFDVFGAYFYFAAQELWRDFCAKGSARSLDLARRVSTLLWDKEVSHSAGGRERERASTLFLWMNVQLPRLFRTCTLPDLLHDAEKLCSHLSVDYRDQLLRSGMVEALCGEYRRLIGAKEDDEARNLFQDNADAIERIHNAYIAQSRAFKKDPRNEEQVAWEYLSSKMAPRVQTPGPGNLPDTAADSALLLDPAFIDVIRRGSHEGAYEFVSTRLGEVQQLLMRRLNIQLLPDHLMRPEGSVFSQRAAKSGQVDPDFVSAKQAIERDDYATASRILDRLSKRLHQRPLEICRGYQAYALAKNGELLLAQEILIDLSKARATNSSTYWNLASCIPAEQMERQLQALADGLEYAPHSRTLHGAVFLSLLLNDSRVSRWLTWLTYSEALLLAYYHQFERLTADERNDALVRLNRCVKDGEARDPDPTGSRLSFNTASSFLSDLVQRQQAEAAEFWLRCREGIGRKRVDFWQLKVDLLDQTGQRAAAAEAFRQELNWRLDALRTRKNLPGNHPRGVRERAEIWLRHCMTPQLKGTGEALFKMLDEFDASQSVRETERAISVSSRDGRIRRFFEPSAKVPPPPPPPLDPTPSLINLLAKVGAEVSSDLHELVHLPRVQPALERLVSGLMDANRRNSERALRRLLDAWRQQDLNAGKAEREGTLRNAQSLYADLRGAFRQELAADELATASLLLQTLERVNNRLARSLDLLPDLVIAAPAEDPIAIDDEVDRAAFPVRVTSRGGGGPVRILGARATLDDGLTEVGLRDRVADFLIEIPPENSTILTFSLPPGVRLGGQRQVGVELHYEFASSTFVSPVVSVNIMPQPCPPLPTRSPYIYSRMLEPEEVETHFFGREAEQETLLELADVGRHRVFYVEGIRRTGKSSLLNSITYEINKRGVTLLPVYASAAKVEPDKPAGIALFNVFQTITKDSRVSASGVVGPTEQRCCDNLTDAYEQFVAELREKLPGQRVLVLFDDFQKLVEGARMAVDGKLALAASAPALLELIRGSAASTSSLLWLLAGHRARRQFRSLLGGVLLWADLRGIEIDFLKREAVASILRVPLEGTPISIPPETVARVHAQTAGHPEFVQQMGEEMFRRATRERRLMITPSDADEAARDIASSEDKFADIWYPLDELSREQRGLTASLIEAVKTIGGRLDQARLVAGKQLSDQQRMAIDDLVARKILDSSEAGLGVKALILELWLRRVIPQMMTEVSGGSVAIFIDVANLTAGTGAAVLTNLNTSIGEGGIPGRFALENVIDCIEDYSRPLSQAPAAARWVVNYPLKSPAVVVCSSKGYYVENIPRELIEKGSGSDDMVLAEKIWEVESRYPIVNHFVLVLGDKDYAIAIDRLLKNGKTVHLISRQSSRARRYEYLAREYPARFITTTLEHLLEKRVLPPEH